MFVVDDIFVLFVCCCCCCCCDGDGGDGGGYGVGVGDGGGGGGGGEENAGVVFSVGGSGDVGVCASTDVD